MVLKTRLIKTLFRFLFVEQTAEYDEKAFSLCVYVYEDYLLWYYIFWPNLPVAHKSQQWSTRNFWAKSEKKSGYNDSINTKYMRWVSKSLPNANISCQIWQDISIYEKQWMKAMKSHFNDTILHAIAYVQ